MLAKLLSEASEKIMDSAYEDKSTARGIAKVISAGFIDGLSDGIIILGTTVMIASMINGTKKNNVSKKG